MSGNTIKAALLLSVFTTAFAAAVARADTTQTFALQGSTFLDGATANGRITVDTTTGVFTGLDITFVDGATIAVFNSIGGQRYDSDIDQYYFFGYDAAGDVIDLGVPGANLIGYAGGPICSGASDAVCHYAVSYVQLKGQSLDGWVSGELVPTLRRHAGR